MTRTAARRCLGTTMVAATLACQTPSEPLGTGTKTMDTSSASTPTTTSSTTATSTSTTTVTTPTTTDTTTPTGSTTDTAPSNMAPAVILFIGDGMGVEHVRGGSLYAHGVEGALTMENLGFSGALQTASLSGYTDSAASATTMGTGAKTYNGVVGLDRHGETVENLRELAASLGWATGVVTSDTVLGGTPASFMAHTSSRNNYTEISAQVLEDLPDALLGGGHSYLSSVVFKTYGVDLVTTREALTTYTPSDAPLVGIFGSGSLPYVLDSDGDDPTLAELTLAALTKLGDDPDGLFLMVEGARIDHASHSNDGSRVFQEVEAFDDAIAATTDWLGDRPATVLVTADHECGGLRVDADGAVKGVPVPTTWTWGDHTNDDVPIFGMGPHAELFDGERRHNSWVHAALQAAILDAPVVEPSIPRLADGSFGDLEHHVAFAEHATDFGEGFNQLDALWVTADEEGLWIGIAGVFEAENNATILWVDRDYGFPTGLREASLSDTIGTLDLAIGNVRWTTSLPGLGVDLAIGNVGSRYARYPYLYDQAGVRGFVAREGVFDNLYWSTAVFNVDDGNLSQWDLPARDAAPFGTTEGGMEIGVPWTSLYADGLPARGADLALVVTLVNTDGTWISNQSLPSVTPAEGVGAGTLSLDSAVTLSVDGKGQIVKAPARID